MRRAMEHAGIRQAQMMYEFGVSKTTLGRWTHDDPAAKGPSNAELHRWAEMCGVPFDWLMTGAGSINDAAPDSPEITPARDAAMRDTHEKLAQAKIRASAPDENRLPRQT